MSPPDRRIPVVDELGREFRAAWRAEERRVRARRRRFAGLGALAVASLVTVLGLALGTGRGGPSSAYATLVVAHGATARGEWRLVAYGSGARRCLALVAGTPVSPPASCPAAVSSIVPLTVGTRVLDGRRFIFGSVASGVARVRVTSAGHAAATVSPRRSARLPRARYFVAVLGNSGAPPNVTVTATSADGVLVARVSPRVTALAPLRRP